MVGYLDSLLAARKWRPNNRSEDGEACETYACGVLHDGGGMKFSQARRREMMRQERMEADARERELDEGFRRRQRALAEQEEQRTAKRRAKRLKKKVGCRAGSSWMV